MDFYLIFFLQNPDSLLKKITFYTFKKKYSKGTYFWRGRLVIDQDFEAVGDNRT